MKRLLTPVLSLAALILFVGPALAHGGDEFGADDILTAWQFAPDIVAMTLVVLAVYGNGIWRRRTAAKPHPWRHVMFIGGVAAVFMSLVSPIDAMADRLFWMHQIQHMLLRIIGPLLIALSLPAGTLVAGLPGPVRKRVLAPVLSSRAVRSSYALAASPVSVTVIFIASLYVWEIPWLHDLAIENEGIHYVMHVTMLAAGLLFLVRMFDSRPPPHGIRYGHRLMMLWLSILSSIVLGALTALKPIVLYHAYDLGGGRLFHWPALADEQFGGVLIWIPSSMMFLLAVIIVIDRMARNETRLDRQRRSWKPSNYESMAWPTTGAELIAGARVKNRQMALGFAGFCVAVFATAIMTCMLLLTMEHADTARAAARTLDSSIATPARTL